MSCVFLIVLVWTSPSWAQNQVDPPPAAPGSSAVAGNSDIDLQLKSALVEAVKKIGPLEVWQKKIFDEEVLPHFQRFIKDYRPSPSGLSVEVDLKNLENYLRFFAPKAIKNTPLRAMVYLKTDSNCTKCGDANPSIRILVQERLERRGLSVFWVTPEELGGSRLGGEFLEEKITEVAQQKGYAAAVIIQWNPESLDSAHADDKRYEAVTFVSMAGLGKNGGKLEVLENDSFETAVHRLLTDSLTDFGTKVEMTAKNQEGAEEITVEVSGINGFADFTRIKAQLQAQLKGISLVEERKLSRGQVVFAVYTNKSRQEIETQLPGIVLAPEGATQAPVLRMGAQ